MGGKFDFFSPSGFGIKSDFDYRTSEIRFYSSRALKCYLNEKNLINGRVTATIPKFNLFEEIFWYNKRLIGLDLVQHTVNCPIQNIIIPIMDLMLPHWLF